MQDHELVRLQEDEARQKNWKRWGTYLSERQWGTVREDYSKDGSCWDYLPHDHARSRAYRWGEDGLLGLTDRECRLCFSFAFWNGRDSILKERLFGLGGSEGNHGEDVKEMYFYLDGTPTHSYTRALYKYPQEEFPYGILVSENKQRGRSRPEYEIVDTGIFDSSRYFDLFIEYAKAAPNDILIRLTAVNRGPVPAHLHVLPTVWFRNNWSWGRKGEGYVSKKPVLIYRADGSIRSDHDSLEPFNFVSDPSHPGIPLFTENETNIARLFQSPMEHPYVKDSFNAYVVHGKADAVNPAKRGTKAAFYSKYDVESGGSLQLRFRLFNDADAPKEDFGPSFDQIFSERLQEADHFYRNAIPKEATSEEQRVMRQAYAGLVWSKQFYFYSVREWLEGDPLQPPTAPSRKFIRNTEWEHLYNRDVISMPDKWEYPWYAAWDLAFHMISFARIDPEFAKQQLILLLREWYMHPTGQIPAYEFAFSDVNPPVHAWACWRIYKITAPKGKRDRTFLARVFQKLLINFTWWVNRKDVGGNNLFSGGFLGLDNIGVFDRGQPVPGGGYLEQADATAWMAFFCGNMLSMALELASYDHAYEDVASKFFEHFISITDSINNFGGTGLWDEQDGFYYDQIRVDKSAHPMRIRSLVGIIPLLATEVLDQEIIDRLPGFRKRMEWFIEHRPDLAQNISCMEAGSNEEGSVRLLAIPSQDRLRRVLNYVLDEKEFLSPYGIRSLSKIHGERPFVFPVDGQVYSVQYVPGESSTSMFGGNSNWRGPVWFPINYLLIEALERYHHFYDDRFLVEFPTGSGNHMNLRQVARELSMRHVKIFMPNHEGSRPCHGEDVRFRSDPAWRDLVLFYEFFHGDTAKGYGASHQTGWTALVTRCLERKY